MNKKATLDTSVQCLSVNCTDKVQIRFVIDMRGESRMNQDVVRRHENTAHIFIKGSASTTPEFLNVRPWYKHTKHFLSYR